MVPEWFWATFAATIASMPPTLIFLTWYTSRKGLERDEVVRAQRARIEELEQKRRELEARVEELEQKLRDVEAEWARKLREKDGECERRVRQLEEACEARVREASRLSSTARTLFEAFKAGVVELSIKGEECDEIEVQPGKILCCKSGECRVVWPERGQPGEEVIVVRKRAANNRNQPRDSGQPRRKRERPEAEAQGRSLAPQPEQEEPEPEEDVEPEELYDDIPDDMP